METDDQNNSDRLIKILSEVGDRVENLRDQASSIERERENILGLLQDIQDLENHKDLSEVEKEDIESTTERLILRCLTVEVSVSTPRNEIQEEAFKSVTQTLDELHQMFQLDPLNHSYTIESYLNACLPEPFSSNLDTRFQSKILGCTADDQKRFRQKLQSMHRLALKMPYCNGTEENKMEASSVNETQVDRKECNSGETSQHDEQEVET
ncbi:BAG family molecular chaperone regulator 2-like [Ruditapes philippinarum]|uniref:BAG family molecular chaperone regulator 2-like n=1 Tax=Ruditapes philippinarum TaxID=129788 RepID=UPI00295B1E5F|nr:BAG family molecular chaperone regulator 2-like [Ruditapes philippinarum]